MTRTYQVSYVTVKVRNQLSRLDIPVIFRQGCALGEPHGERAAACAYLAMWQGGISVLMTWLYGECYGSTEDALRRQPWPFWRACSRRDAAEATR